jgi:hypothetical protein
MGWGLFELLLWLVRAFQRCERRLVGDLVDTRTQRIVGVVISTIIFLIVILVAYLVFSDKP